MEHLTCEMWKDLYNNLIIKIPIKQQSIQLTLKLEDERGQCVVMTGRVDKLAAGIEAMHVIEISEI